jgi:hypothetical protein
MNVRNFTGAWRKCRAQKFRKWGYIRILMMPGGEFVSSASLKTTKNLALHR